MNCSLTIVIVSYNSRGSLDDCLRSVFSGQGSLSLQVIVVDNASQNDVVNALNERFPQVTLLRNEENVGFARACNQGLALAWGDLILFLNPDTVIKGDVLTRCAEFLLSRSDAGIVGCKLFNPDGSLQPSCADFPHLCRMALDHLLRTEVFSSTLRNLRKRLFLKYWDHDCTREVDWILGAFMLTRTELAKQLGGFDENFFLYGEDLDLCYRVRRAGWKVVFFPHAGIIHTGNPVWDSGRLARVYDAYLRFYRKHFPGSRSVLLETIVKAKLLLSEDCP